MEKVIAVVFVVACIILAGLLFSGWMLMLAIGAVHSIYGWPTITVSYLNGVITAWSLGVVGAIFGASTRTSK